MTRRARHPIAAVSVMLAVPGAVLCGLWAAADRVAGGPIDDPPPVELTLRIPVGDSAAEQTELLSLRRTAPALAAELNITELQERLAAFSAQLNDRSCLEVSIDGRPVWSQGADIAAIPGSVQKILVASVAEEILGADFSFVTEVLGDLGPDGVVAGDLYLLGGGDPLLASDWYPRSGVLRYPMIAHTSLDSLADRVVAAGVRSVRGDLVGDASGFDDEIFAPGWGPGVGGVDGGPIGALTANDGLVQGDSQRQSDPAIAAVREFRRLLNERGVTIEGSAIAGRVPPPDQFTGGEIARIESAALPSIITEILFNSHNNTSEALVKQFGVVGRSEGTREAGLAVLAAELDRSGVDLSGSVLTDGSGLSRENLLRCPLVLGVLQVERPNPVISAALPVLGQSGTLETVLTMSPAAGRMLAKTGTLSNPPIDEDPPAAKGLAGYLEDLGDGTIEFVLLLNGPSISASAEYLPLWEQLAAILAGYPQRAGIADLGPR